MFGISNDCGEYIMNRAELRGPISMQRKGSMACLVTNEGVQRVWMGRGVKARFGDIAALK